MGKGLAWSWPLSCPPPEQSLLGGGGLEGGREVAAPQRVPSRLKARRGGAAREGRGLTVQLYLTQSSQKRLAENFLRRTTVSP